MNFFKKNKKILIAVAVFAVALFVYMTFFSGQDDDQSLVATNIATTESATEIDLITLLFELKNVDLDGGLFEKRSFQSLIDFGQEILPEPVGRPNPFAPTGIENGNSQSPDLLGDDTF